MPFTDWNRQQRVSEAAVEDAKAFEDETGIPVRFIAKENRPSRHDTHTRWQGASRSLTHYVDGVSEDDFATKGVTVFINSYPEHDEEHNMEYVYRDVPTNELTKEGWGEYGPGRTELPATFAVEVYGPDAETVEQLGGVPIVVGDYCIGASFDDGRCVFIYYGSFEASNYAHFNFPALVFEPAKIHADPEYLAALIERQAAEARDAFIMMMQDRGEAAITEARENSDRFAVEYARAQEAQVIAKGNLDSYAKQLEILLERGDDVTDEMVTREWESIASNVNVERFTAGKNKTEPVNARGEETGGTPIDNSYLKLFTKHLWLTNPSTGRKLPLGKFEVDMNFGTNRLKIRNLTMPQHNGECRIDHPHVRDGYLCAAEYATAVTTLLRDRKLASMTNMVFSILSTVTLEDTWGRSGMLLWEQMDNDLRRTKGWSEWTADEDEHPLALEEAAAADTADVPDDTTTEAVA